MRDNTTFRQIYIGFNETSRNPFSLYFPLKSILNQDVIFQVETTISTTKRICLETTFEKSHTIGEFLEIIQRLVEVLISWKKNSVARSRLIIAQ